MDNQIDARRKTCPVPVIMAKKEADEGKEKFSVLVDNPTAVENLKRFGASSGYASVVKEIGSDYEVDFTKTGCSCDVPAAAPEDDSRAAGKKSWAVFVGKEMIGAGDPELGENLLKMFFYTLTQDENIPEYLLFMNAGVKIPVENEQITEHLKELQDKGAQVLVCGTCLNFYEIADKLQTGTVSNMYDIVGAMKSVDKVITV